MMTTAAHVITNAQITLYKMPYLRSAKTVSVSINACPDLSMLVKEMDLKQYTALIQSQAIPIVEPYPLKIRELHAKAVRFAIMANALKTTVNLVMYFVLHLMMKKANASIFEPLSMMTKSIPMIATITAVHAATNVLIIR
jgi:hypothetical protein